jgi:hypothetical protein
MRPKTVGAPLTFGDVIEADWLFDLYLREQSEALTAITERGNLTRYTPTARANERQAGKDYAIGFATDEARFESPAADPGFALGFGNRRKAVVLSDECEAPKVLARGGRLLVASIVPWPTNPEEAAALVGANTSSWRRYPLPEETPWLGGVIDFSRHVGVWHAAIPHATISFEMTGEEQELLKIAWTAYSSRLGPIVGADGVRKLIEMLHGGGDDGKRANREPTELTPEEKDAIARFEDLCDAAYILEGPVLDQVSAAHELHGNGRDELSLVLRQLAAIRNAASAAEEALRKAS